MSAALLNIAENMIIDRIIGGQSPVSHSNKAAIGIGILALIGVLTSFAFFIAGFYIWMSSNVPAYEAALYTGGLCLGVAAVLMLGLSIAKSYRRQKIEQSKDELTNTIASVCELIEHDFGDQIKENPKASIAMATLAGFAAQRMM